jgi:hypothetical protein
LRSQLSFALKWVGIETLEEVRGGMDDAGKI